MFLSVCASKKQLLLSEVLDGRLERFGVHMGETSRAGNPALTDGENVVWIFSNASGVITTLWRHSGNANYILEVVGKAFDTWIYRDDDQGFWEFMTRGQWERALEEGAKAEREEFYHNLIKFVRGEPHNLHGSKVEAEFAKILIKYHPELALESAKDQLLSEVDALYGAMLFAK